MLLLTKLCVRGTVSRSVLSSPAALASFSSSAPIAPMIINGKKVLSEATRRIPVYNPATQELVCEVPETTEAEFNRAVQAAQDALPSWRATPVQQRARVFLRYQQLIRDNMEKIASLITEEQGKTLEDAKGDVFRGLEVVEYACGAASELMGEISYNVGRNVDTFNIREPLGVCAGICPFNFPAMIPLWMFPMATVAGNTYVLKPSEKDPGAAIFLAELAQEAGLPDGVLNLVHGSVDTVNRICDHPAIQAISFVGGNNAGHHIYTRGTANGKRVQANLGAKNHGVVLPDADKNATINALVGAAFGAAGQRCMALSTVVFVGQSKDWIHEIVEKAKNLRVSGGFEAFADLGPMIDNKALKRAEELIQSGVDEGASLLLDGRGIKVEKYPKGNFLGPTVLDNVSTSMRCYKEEIFGPVLVALHVDTFDEAIQLVNQNRWGNGTALFTRNGAAARKYIHEIEAGQVGINLPIPVPLPFFSFTGNKESILGETNFYGKAGFKFFTQMKTVTTSWKDDDLESSVQMTMPILRK